MNATQLQKALGVSFKDRRLLRQALTHPSYVHEHPEEAGGSNQRLEFLGDALIGLTVAQRLYLGYPQLDEGALTESRARLVRGLTLAAAARRLGLGQHLLLGQGEAASGGRDRESNLAAALEALAAAVLLDLGLRAARRFVWRVLKLELAPVETLAQAKDPKSRLQELAHRSGRPAPQYELSGVEGPPHSRRFTVQVRVDGEVVGTGEGGRKIDAERQAALEALRLLEQR